MPNLLAALGLKPLPVLAGGAPVVGAAVARGDEGGTPPIPVSPSGGAAGGMPSGGQPGSPSPQNAGPSGAKAGSSPEAVAYAKERLAVTKLRTALGKHKQAWHVADKTIVADAALTAAATHASTPDWPKAMAELTSAKTACEDGKTFADGYADYLVHRAAANLLLTASLNSGWTFTPATLAILPAADLKAASPTRDYAGAKADVDSIPANTGPNFKVYYIDAFKPQVATLKALPAAAFIAAEIAEIDKVIAQQQTLYTAKQWRQMALNAGLLGGLLPLNGRLSAAQKIAIRRAEFDTARKLLDPAIAKVQALGKAVAAPLATITRRAQEIDTMASHAVMQIEEAKATLPALIATCASVELMAASAAPYRQERAAVAGDLSKLREHPAAARIKAELDVIRDVLTQAAEAAGDKGAPGTELVFGADPAAHDIATARVRLGQARANLTTARSLADGLGGAAAVEELVGNKPNLTDLRKGLDALVALLATAQQAADAALAKEPFAKVQAGIDETKKQIDAKDPAAAAKAIAAGTAQLAEGRRIQIQHGAFLERRKLLQGRLDQYNADKAMAAKVQLKLDELGKALKAADAAETSGDQAVAMAELNKGEAAAGAVDSAAVNRAAFDKAANLAQFDLDQPEFAGIKAAQNKEITRARALAFVMNFDGANDVIKSVRNAMVALQAKGMASKTPPDPKLMATAKKLADAGATDELDKLIADLPKTADKQAFVELAQARFKMTIEAEGGDGTGAQESIQRMCFLMKDIPKDVIDNPSLKKIKRRVTREQGVNPDGSNTQAFPFYVPNKDEMVMNSRPGQYKKPEFQPNGTVGRLPDREDACQPAPPKPGTDGSADLFDFNMLHELAHAIDDARGYMAAKGKEADHGGWIEIGGKIEPIVDAVVKETGFGTTAEERQYVLDRILGNPALLPWPAGGDAKRTRFESFANAAVTDNVWDSQALTDQATLGKRVYHQGYPGTWFSYLAAARKQGITSYQFRAPGEWFSELYAAWKLDKLKESHPAVAWLKTIKAKAKA